MIREMSEFTPWDINSARVLASYRSYRDIHSRTAQFWLQDDCAALSLVDDFVQLSAKPDADFEELAAFLQMLPWRQLQCEDKLAQHLPFFEEQKSMLVEFIAPKRQCKIAAQIASDPGEIYDILAQCFSDMQNRSLWMADMALRWRRGTAQTWLLNGFCTVSALHLTENYCFLGAVGTLPQARGQGLAGRLLCAVASQQQTARRDIYLSCREELLPFYESVGFVRAGSFAMLRKGEDA